MEPLNNHYHNPYNPKKNNSINQQFINPISNHY